MSRIRDTFRHSSLEPVYAANPRLRGFMSLLLLSGALLLGVVGAVVLGSAAGMLFPEGAPSLLATSAVNTALMFGMPGLLVCLWMKLRPADYLSLRGPASPWGWRWLICALALFYISLPMLNQTIWWNENLPVPDAGLWHTLRELEDSAAAVTRIMLGGESVGSLIACVLIVGVLTGFCEELFFRGALQKTLGMCGLGPNAAIWVSATVFSLLHFQFFGFVPRLLLGAVFGYMMLYSRSVWVPASMHALNNSIVVVVTWLANRGAANADIVEDFGVAKEGVPLTALASAIIVAAMISTWKKKTENASSKPINP